ncbi:MAG: NADH-quinone oxidoreductase subunit N [Deltaproteobacteria bacterium]|nr:NADH-quinone oxidoreductase subunit N [Deltaproteobacteria bacterium]
MPTLALPELLVLATALVVLVADLFVGQVGRRQLLPVALVGVCAALGALLAVVPDSGELLGGRFAVDPLGWWFKLALLGAAAGVLALAQPAWQGDGRAGPTLANRGEFLAVLLFNLAGMLVVPSARDAVTFYLALETATMPLFLLVAWRRNAAGAEAALKYLVVGALASAMLLYGLAWLYGVTGTLDLTAMAGRLPATPAAYLGLGLVVGGLGFKLTLAPLHFWAPQVYAGAPLPVAAWLGTASKGAAVAAVVLVLYRVAGPHAQGWTLAVALLAALTMTIGNLGAVVQTNVLRLLAFSAVSQAGYLLVGLCGATRDGAAAVTYYLLVYVVTNLGAFAAAAVVHHHTGSQDLAAFRGLSRRHPLLALAMMLALFGLAGIPPLGGFTGKFFLFAVAAQADLHGLVAVAAVNSTVSLYYYLRIVRQMYIEPDDSAAPATPTGLLPGLALVTATAGGIALGVVPWFYETVRAAAAGWP